MTDPRTAIRQAPYVAPVSFHGWSSRAGARYPFVGIDVIDSIAAGDSLLSSPGIVIADSVALADALGSFRAALLQDGIGLSEAIAQTLTAASAVSDTAAAADGLRAGYVQSVADSAVATDAAGLASSLASTIADLVHASEAYAPGATASTDVSDGVVVTDAAITGLVAVIADAVTAAAAAVGVTAASVTITDTAVIAETLDLAQARQALITDTIAAADSAASFLAAVQSIRDSIVFTVEVVTPDGDRYVGWVYSPASQAAAEIAGYDFFELVSHPLGTIAARSDGLYLLKGTTDDGSVIPWYLRTGKMPLGDGMQSRPETVYVSGVSEGDITLRVTASGGRMGEQEADYTLDRVADGVAENFRAKLGKGLRGAFVQFALFGEDDADITGLMVRFIKKSRRL